MEIHRHIQPIALFIFVAGASPSLKQFNLLAGTAPSQKPQRQKVDLCREDACSERSILSSASDSVCTWLTLQKRFEVCKHSTNGSPCRIGSHNACNDGHISGSNKWRGSKSLFRMGHLRREPFCSSTVPKLLFSN